MLRQPRKWILLLLLASSALAQTTTSVTGIIKDLGGTLQTSGKVVFTLRPSVDSTISGSARFIPAPPVTCRLASTGNIVNAANTNVTTTVGTTNPGTSVVVTSATGFAIGQAIYISGAGAGSAGYVGTITNIIGTTFTISPATSTSVSAGAAVYDPCQITQNTSLTPAGTYYQVDLCPSNACLSKFTTYAIAPLVDFSTLVPTPATSPVYPLANLFSDQVIGGQKTFTGPLVVGDGFVGFGFACTDQTLTSPSNVCVGIGASGGGANKVSQALSFRSKDSGGNTLTGLFIQDDTGEMVWLPAATATHRWFQSLAFVMPGDVGGGYSCSDGAVPLYGDPDADCFSAGAAGTGNNVDSQHYEMHARSAGGVTLHGDMYTDKLGSLTFTTDTSGVTRILPKTFASYQGCSASFEGSYAAVTDSSTDVWGNTVTGGGANHVLMFCDGTNWTVAAK